MNEFLPTAHCAWTLLIAITLIAAHIIRLTVDRLPKLLEIEWKTESCEILNINSDTTVAPLAHRWSLLHHCNTCHQRLSFLNLLPIIGKLLYRKCPHCHADHGLSGFFIDVVTLLCSIAVFMHFGISTQCVYALVYTWLLISLIFIDIHHQLLPDQLTLLLLWIGLIISTQGVFLIPSTSIIGAASGYLFFYLIALFFKIVTGKDGMGYGDFKMLAALGAWVGWVLLPVLVLISALLACVAGIVFMIFKSKGESQAYAFGPYLAIGGWVTLLYGTSINDCYIQFLGNIT